MTSNDQLATELAAELRARAGDLHGAPISFAGVRGRARSIRRRRQGVAAGAVAAVVAVILVVPTLLGAGAQRSERPQPAPPAPEQTQGVPMLHRGTLTLLDGTRRDLGLRARDVSQFGVLTDGRVVLANQARSRIEVYDDEGALTQTYPVEFLALTMSPTDELAAWVERDSRVQVLESGSAAPVEMAPVPLPGEATPVIDAVVGSDCASGGCRVLAGEGNVTMSQSDVDGAGDLVTSEELRILDVSPDEKTWAVSFPPGPNAQYGCVGLYDVPGAIVTARSCRTSGLEFSPDGEHLVGAFYENFMASDVTVLDRDLSPVLAYRPRPRVVSRVAWDGATHLLAGVVDTDDSSWSLERVAIDDGSSSTLDGPAPGANPEIVAEYQFAG
jgi:hypothetical protein